MGACFWISLILVIFLRFWSPGPRKSPFGTPPKPCRSHTQPRARCPRRRPRLPCTSARSAGGRGRRAPSVSWLCSRAFLRRFCPPGPQISTKIRRKECGRVRRPPRACGYISDIHRIFRLQQVALWSRVLHVCLGTAACAKILSGPTFRDTPPQENAVKIGKWSGTFTAKLKLP